MRTSRLDALLCTSLFVCSELVSWPFAELGVADDWSYVRTAQILSQTGHVVYNGWATAIIGWQLYFAAAFMKMFGPTFASARMTTLIVGALNTFVMHRIFVRAGITRRNARLATLAIALSPLYMLLSATFMTDIQGLFGIVVCFYCCIRALQTAEARTAIGWLFAATLTNALIGTSRQIAWLGVLVLIPSTTWLLRSRRAVLWTGLFCTGIGALFVLWCMHWFQRQPYSVPEGSLFTISTLHQSIYAARQLLRAFFEIPFLALPIMLVFISEARNRRRVQVAIVAVLALFTVLALVAGRHHGMNVLLEPLLGDWLSSKGFLDIGVNGVSPVVLTTSVRFALTFLTITGIACVLSVLLRTATGKTGLAVKQEAPTLSWRQLSVLLGPFTLAYFLLLVPRATGNLRDRYIVTFVFLAVLCLVKLYQENVQPTLPRAASVLVVLAALFSIAATHDMFALNRARIGIITEFRAQGVPPTEIDGGFEYDGLVELDEAGHLNEPRVANPPHSFVPVAQYQHLTCREKMESNLDYLHFMPRVGLAWQADACHSVAPVGPKTYPSWLMLRRVTIYPVTYGIPAD